MNSSNQSAPVSSNYRWVICALLFFATTFNYMDRQVISYLKDYIFCKPMETAASFSTISANDLYLPALASKLNHSTDAVSAYIKTNLTASTLLALGNYSGSGSFPQTTNLVENLNALIQSHAIYDPQRFSGITLRPETQRLLALNPSGDALAHLNRLLLDDAYPQGISRGGFGWTNKDFSFLTTAFTMFYGGMTLLMGWVIDRIGTKLGLALSLIFWSVCGIVNAFVGGLVMMHVMIRSAFAVGEAGNFPASIKTVAEWFPKRERALATGIFNSGSNFGAMVAALVVPLILIHFSHDLGWKMAFILTGASGFLWLIFWFWLYDTPHQQKRLSKTEYDYIHIDDEAAATEANGDKGKLAWWKLFGYRQGWAFFFGKFMTDGIWWFYLFWLPDYLEKQFNMTTRQVMLPTFIVYGIAIIGSVYGGSIPLTLIKKGMPVYKARMTAMLLIAVVPLAVLLTQYFGDVSRFGGMAATLAVAMIAIGAAAHQAWSANLFTTVSDMFPKKAVGSVTGIGTTAGAIGGSIVQLLAGVLNDTFKSHPQTAYLIMFIVCALSYLTAWIVMKALVPRHKPITDL
jgi:ACS family hexuronate transporter-like MFS transporter